MKVLVSGWFSFEQMGATGGDIIARDQVCNWLSEAGILYDIALAPPFSGGVDWKEVDPGTYSDVVFVCGPFGNGWPVTAFLERFAHCRLSGINLSMLQPTDEWNPFELLLERDSTRTVRPDITFLGPKPHVPVVGLILAHKQLEYGKDSLHDQANRAIKELLASREASVVPIDTSLENNAGGLRTEAEIESLIAKMDLVVTTRLHGTVLSIKNGVPVIPVDPISGGAKISMQVKCIGWPVLFGSQNLDLAAMQEAFDYCLTEEARRRALESALMAREKVRETKKLFMQMFSRKPVNPVSHGQD